MSDVIDYKMPSYAELEGAPAEGFALQVAPGQYVQVERVALRVGVAMNADYECYAAIFALPQGVVLPQAVFRLRGPAVQAQEWVLLMTPTQPEPDGRHALEAVIHRLRHAA
ncbi:hypothetical protein IAE33_001682 [Pseudomonas sp. S60]|uniref:DUF6916 family protein n=1 Tax=unclassified Pseudomonas TaxID=196821 RepID=UPI0019141486|nr:MULTISPECIES: hypothetical protein [unclassified Pseudomonas]MBK5007313.1 hypothetical protein [Pseudomonas sp. S32]MBK5009822.1 hypothetical protein [Pseudomonas sp. S60]